MNRRGFLKTLTAIGVAAAVPVSLARMKVQRARGRLGGTFYISEPLVIDRPMVIDEIRLIATAPMEEMLVIKADDVSMGHCALERRGLATGGVVFGDVRNVSFGTIEIMEDADSFTQPEGRVHGKLVA